MQKVEYFIYLSNDLTDRLRVNANKHNGEILEFVVQYEAKIGGKWQAIVRYDTAHGFAHKDVLNPDNTATKYPIYFQTYNLAMTFATLDLKANWKQFKKQYEQKRNNDKGRNSKKES